MAKCFYSGGRAIVGALFALTSALLLMTSCSTETGDNVADPDSSTNKDVTLPVSQGPFVPDLPIGGPIGPGPFGPFDDLDTIAVMVRSDPAEPQNERFLDLWRIQAFNIDDEGRQLTPSFSTVTGQDGNALVVLPSYYFALPLVLKASNDVLALLNEEDEDDEDEDDESRQCSDFEVFVPAFCWDKAVWLLGPFEDALWRFYRRAAEHRGEAWNPSQVDCATWLANMQLLILTDEVSDELNDLSDSTNNSFNSDELIEALQQNQHLLVPTRPPICMAERRHQGGGMERGDVITAGEGNLFNIDETNPAFGEPEAGQDDEDDPVFVDLTSGLIESICNVTGWADEALVVNGVTFVGDASFVLDDPDFLGTVTDDPDIVPLIDATTFNVRLGNGFPWREENADDACATTTIIQFTNNDDDEQDLKTGSGVTLFNLFSDSTNTGVFLTSDGDAVVDDNDTWAIFYRTTDERHHEQVLAVELLGIRKGDWRDNLHMTYDPATENLFLGLRADFELNEEETDGEQAFLAYTLSAWDGSTEEGRELVRLNIADCYEAADVWARQQFVTRDFARRDDDCCADRHCKVDHFIRPLEAAEFAVRSECFSNSRANQRWRTQDSGFWSINNDHGVTANVVVNAGWLAPNLDFRIYVQRFDEAVFKGPRDVVTSDDIGQLLIPIPTLVEGDRVLIKAEDACCDDFDLVIPCVPEFTGFAGLPGVPYVPVTLGPPPPPPLPPGPIPPVVPFP